MSIELQTDTSGLEWIDIPHGRLGWCEHYLCDADRLYDLLVSELDWQQPEVKVFGKTHPVPRKLDFQGDADVAYGYSGLRHQASPWHPALQALRQSLLRDLGLDFNCVLVNWYRDGADSMGFHSDDEAELGQNPVIASLSLGANRRFMLRPRRGLQAEPRELGLAGGSLLVMAGETQHYWQHGVPKQRAIQYGRINLTFRKVQCFTANS